jgi:hypothetical protein
MLDIHSIISTLELSKKISHNVKNVFEKSKKKNVVIKP